MDGESLIYIIIAIIYFVVSAIGSRNKAKKKKEMQRRKSAGETPDPDPARRPPVPESTAPQEPNLQDIFEELFGEGQQRQPRPAMPDEMDAIREMTAEKEARRRAQQEETGWRERQRRQEETRKHRQRMEAAKRFQARMDQQKKKSPAPKKHSAIFNTVSIRDAIIVKAILDRPYR
jgi:hypothetical protein